MGPELYGVTEPSAIPGTYNKLIVQVCLHLNVFDELYLFEIAVNVNNIIHCSFEIKMRQTDEGI